MATEELKNPTVTDVTPENTSEPLQSPAKTENDPNLLAQLIGLLRVVKRPLTAAPTQTPKNFLEQLQIYAHALYFWDGSWRAVKSPYAGRYDSTYNFLPDGWSMVNPSTGNYVITHNLGHTNYAVVVTSSSVVVPNVYGHSSNTFSVNFRTLAAADANVYFDFILMEH